MVVHASVVVDRLAWTCFVRPDLSRESSSLPCAFRQFPTGID